MSGYGIERDPAQHDAFSGTTKKAGRGQTGLGPAVKISSPMLPPVDITYIAEVLRMCSMAFTEALEDRNGETDPNPRVLLKALGDLFRSPAVTRRRRTGAGSDG